MAGLGESSMQVRPGGSYSHAYTSSTFGPTAIPVLGEAQLGPEVIPMFGYDSTWTYNSREARCA